MNSFFVALMHPHKGIIWQIAVLLNNCPQNLTYYVFNETRISVSFVDNIQFVGPFEQCVILRTHSAFNERDEIPGLHALICAKKQRSSSTLVMGCQRGHIEHLLNHFVVKALFLQT